MSTHEIHKTQSEQSIPIPWLIVIKQAEVEENHEEKVFWIKELSYSLFWEKETDTNVKIFFHMPVAIDVVSWIYQKKSTSIISTDGQIEKKT